MSAPLRILLVGAAGRMGQAISKAAESQDDIVITGLQRGGSIAGAIGECDVVIDFSHAEVAEASCAACVQRQKPLVIGTTGHSREQLNVIEEAARSVPVVLAPNFSVGVNALFWLTRKAAELVGDEFDVEIIETHHRLKKDAPSGTAKRLGELLCASRGLRYDTDVAHGRAGLVGERPQKQIGMHAIRAGDVVGEHTVVFAGAGERLELTHKASSRETFAHGALRAARWVIARPAGIYSMEDVLDLDRTDG